MSDISNNSPSKVSSWEILILLFVLVLATAFRLEDLSTLPYGAWYDEAENTLVIKRILTEPSYWPLFVADKSQLPALSFYLFAPFVALFPDGVLGVRVGATVVGILSILATWLLARETLGSKIAIFAAFFLAITRWHVNFSRFGMCQIFITLTVPLTLYLICVAWRKKSLTYSSLGGVSAGIALQTYYSSIIIPPLVIALLILLKIRDKASIFLLGKIIATFLIVTFLTYLPVAFYAWTNWEQFSERFRTVSGVKLSTAIELPSLFFSTSPSTEVQELALSIKKHILMFNFAGDLNGRHNLPLAPMLDPITGSLFVIGLFLACTRFYKVNNFISLLWFTAFMFTGIFSLTFEAPQGGRTLGVAPLIAIFAAQAFNLITTTTGRIFYKTPLYNNALIVFVLSSATFLNWDLFFNYQLKRFDAWASYSTLETRVGELLRNVPKDTPVFVLEQYSGGPTVEIYSPNRAKSETYLGLEKLPLLPKYNGAYFVVSDDNIQLKSKIELLYPDAEIESFAPPNINGKQQKSLANIYFISKRDIKALMGWDFTCSSDDKSENKPEVITRVSASGRIDFTSLSLLQHCIGKLSGALVIQNSGEYSFDLDISAPVVFKVGERSLSLNSGKHLIKSTLPQGTIPISIKEQNNKATRLDLKVAGINGENLSGSIIFSSRAYLGGLLTRYMQGANGDTDPSIFTVEQSINRYFHYLPLERPYSIKWSGFINLPENGDYQFELKGVDTVQLTIDGQLIAQHPERDQPPLRTVYLKSGRVRFEVFYQALTNYNEVIVNWRVPSWDKLREIDPSYLEIGDIDLYSAEIP